MRNLSKAFKQKALRDERDYLVFATITLEDSTVLSLTNSEIWSNGFSYEEAVSSDDEFNALGSAVIGSATLIINNIYETFSPYDFTNARVEVEIGMYVVDEESEDDEEILDKYKIGIYTVDETVYNGGTIRLSLLDDMEQFDRPYTTSLIYPATLYQIVNDACTSCNVPLNTPEFPHRTYVVQTAPEESTTFREVLSWAAAIAGCFVKCNPFGELEFKWFNSNALENEFSDFIDGGTFNPWSSDTSVDGGTFNPWNTGAVVDGGTFYEERSVHHITGLFSQTISMDDVVITGIDVFVKIESENSSQDVFTAHAGTSGYVITIENNPFITTSTAQDIATWLGTQLIGLRFRKLSVSIGSDLAIESGDVGVVIDRKQNIYRALITRMSFSVTGAQLVVCGASTPSRNNATRFSSQTKSYVETRKLLRQETSARQLSFQELAGRISNSAGLYTTMVTPQTGGTIYYMHDKPNLVDSKSVWKMTSEVWAVTDDWQGTDAATTAADKWNLGMIVNGDVIARILTADGINADWINTGAITVQDAGGNITFRADVDTGNVIIKAADVPHQYFGSITPTASNYPANQWNTDALKAYHEGDLYTDSNTKKTYKYTKKIVGSIIKFSDDSETEGSSWDYVEIYFNYNNRLYKYSKVGGKSTTNTIAGKEFFIPATEYKLYWHTDSSSNSYYGWRIASVTSTTLVELPSNVYTTSSLPSGTTAITAQTTTPESEHNPYSNSLDQLWTVPTGNSDGFSFEWVEVIGTNTQEVLDEVTQQEIFDKLTNNSQNQGIYLQNGTLYLNFAYAQGQTLKLGGANNSNGLLQIYNSSGVLCGVMDNAGLLAVGVIENRQLYNDPSGTDTNYKIKITDGEVGFYNKTTKGGYVRYYGQTTQGVLVNAVGTLSLESSGTNGTVGLTANNLALAGNSVTLGNSLNTSVVTFNATTNIGAYNNAKNLTVYGDLYVVGNTNIKNRIVETRHYGTVGLGAYETASPYFGDIGTAVIGANGSVIISIDDIFTEVVNKNIEYVVFLQKEGQGDVWVEEKEYDYFVVNGTPGLKFAWELKAVQYGHNYTRLDEFEMDEPDLLEDVGLSMEDDLEAFDKEIFFE